MGVGHLASGTPLPNIGTMLYLPGVNHNKKKILVRSFYSNLLVPNIQIGSDVFARLSMSNKITNFHINTRNITRIVSCLIFFRAKKQVLIVPLYLKPVNLSRAVYFDAVTTACRLIVGLVTRPLFPFCDEWLFAL